MPVEPLAGTVGHTHGDGNHPPVGGAYTGRRVRRRTRCGASEAVSAHSGGVDHGRSHAKHSVRPERMCARPADPRSSAARGDVMKRSAHDA